MALIIVQQTAGLHYELSHPFLDARLAQHEVNALCALFQLPQPAGALRIYLPSYGLDRHACLSQRHFVSGHFPNDQWTDLHNIQNERYNSLRQQHHIILPYIPFFSIAEIEQILNGLFAKDTIYKYRTQLYSIIGRHSPAAVLLFMQDLNIQPVLNPRDFA
jgi:hypothetical protein